MATLADMIGAVEAHEAPLRAVGVRGTAGPYLVSRLVRAQPAPTLVLSPTSKRAERFASDLATFAGPGLDVRLLPRLDTPPFDRFSVHPEVEARRMSQLYGLLASDGSPFVLVAPWSAVMRRVLPRVELRSRVTHLERGLTVDRDALLDVLVSAGYHRTALVEDRGEVAARGGILDLFPPQLDSPVRLEFDFDDIGSIRPFDPATQRSSDEIDRITAIPPRGYRLPHDLDGLVQRVRALGRERAIPESNLYALTESLARRAWPAGIEHLEAVFHDEMESVFDYLPAGTHVVVDDPEAGRTRAAAYADEIAKGRARATGQDRLVCEVDELYLDAETARACVHEMAPILLDNLGVVEGGEARVEIGAADHGEMRHEIQERRGSGRALEPFVSRLDEWTREGRRVRLVSPTLSAAERFADILGEYMSSPPPLTRDAVGRVGQWTDWPEPGCADIAVAPLAEGFDWRGEALTIVTEQDVFGQRHPRRAVRRTREGLAIDRLAQITEGDYLVHAEHGIGSYGGLVHLDLGGIASEFLLIGYAKGDKLYVPVAQLAQVQRYASADGATPRIDRLGGQIWARTKSRVKRAVRDMAEELLAVLAARETLEGIAYPAVDAEYEEFEARFPYEDTPHQRRATEDVLADMNRERPMDRLVCGDVGFGKTEVACRAAFVATAAGKQVAFLVPTTVLCQQHTKSLRERFADTPVEIASISRLSTAKEAKEIRDRLASGQIDILIGTHRILSKDVLFRDLGLLIVDEEHRFGVGHKERLKKMRKLVDVLTLSATPIPRTLQLAFSDMRQLSVITTPPPDRTAVRTQVCRFSEDVIVDSVQRELRRGGQCFFVHNRVETISEFSDYLKRLMPTVKIAVAHGQMQGRALEKVMLAFMNREYDILLCTAIIESGLDIPNANTILIHRADHFGLAQLYQLRGRVGRSDRRAFAYLFLPGHGAVSDDAQRRLEAIQDLSELGAGFRLATEDLEIRGAGNMLGAEQSGHIASVGYDLYMEMLETAIQKLRGEEGADAIEPEIRLPLPALLPEDYVADVSQRLVLYKGLSSARNDEEVAAVRDDLLDRFGPLPEPAANLLQVIALRLRCRAMGIVSVDVKNTDLVLAVGETTTIDPRQLMRVLGRSGTPIRVTPDHRIHLKLRRREDALAESFGLLELLSPGGGETAAASLAPPQERSAR